jgi:hypothetical protein
MRPIQKTLTYATADIAGVATDQTPGYDTEAAATLQTLGNNAPLVLDGTYATGGVVTFVWPTTVTLTSVSNFSATTFTIIGTNAAGAPQTVTRAGPNNNTVATTAVFSTITSVTTNATGYTVETVGAGAGSYSIFAIDGTYAAAGVATLPIAAPVTLTSGDDVSGWSATIIGTDADGAAIYETIDTPNNTTVSTTLKFKTVTSLIIDNTSTFGSDTISAGAAAAGDMGYTAWWPLDIYVPNQVTNISCNLLDGNTEYDVEYTNEDPFDTSLTQLAQAHPVVAFTGATGSLTEFTTTLMRAVRVNITDGVGSLRVTVVQQSTA